MPAPANDLCANAIVIGALPYSSTGLDNTDATTTGGETASASGDGSLTGATALFRSMWWEYTPASNERVRFNATHSDIIIGVYTGACGSLTEVASFGPLTINLTAGVTYKIGLGSFGNVAHTFDFTAAISTNPPNQFQSTATDMTGALPFTETVDLSTAIDGVGFDGPYLYYKYTASSDEVIIGAFAYSASFGARLSVFDGPFNVYDTNVADPSVTVTNKAIQYPLVAGETIIFKVDVGSGTEDTFTIDVQPGPTAASIPSGTLIVTDDTAGFPAIAIDPGTGEAIAALDLPAGEWGDILEDGTFLVDNHDVADSVHLFDRSLTELLDLGTLGAANDNQTRIRISPGLQQFFAGRAGGGGPAASIYQISAAGAVVDSWTLSTGGLATLAPNNDGSIVYVGGQTSSTNTPVKRWLTAGGSFGTDLIAAQGANERISDLLVLDDDTIIAMWLNSSTGNVTIRRLNDGGAVLGTYSKASTETTFPPRLAYDSQGYSDFFWAWTHTTDGFSVFERIDAATMLLDSAIPNVREFSSGTYGGAETATPDARFGVPTSCPFFFMPDRLVLTVPEECCPCDCPEPIGRHGSPTSAPLPSHAGPILPPIDPTSWDPLCAGGGDVPTAADATDPESWVQ